MSELEIIKKSIDGPLTQPKLVKDFQNLGLKKGMVLLVHSSLSSLGWVSGGPAAVILALEEVLGEEGTLIMPTHSGDLSDPGLWENPPVPKDWHQKIRDTMPAFRADLTPSRGMGALPECFRKQVGTIRSNHPHFSFAARGPRAEFITENHSLHYGLGDDSPLGAIYRLGGSVLLLGVGHANNTSLHLAEVRADFPGKKEQIQGAPIIVNGTREWVEQRDLVLNEDDFPEIGEAYQKAGKFQTRGTVGYGEALLLPQKPLVDFAVEWMETHRGSSG
jgi:aminoglycoside 3-N-acetyltransferase